MKLITFETDDGLTLGVVTPDGVLPLDGSVGGQSVRPMTVFAEGESALAGVGVGVRALQEGVDLDLALPDADRELVGKPIGSADL